MKVKIKSFDVRMEVKNRGIEFDVYSPDGREHLGDLVLTKTARQIKSVKRLMGY